MDAVVWELAEGGKQGQREWERVRPWTSQASEHLQKPWIREVVVTKLAEANGRRD